MRGAWVEMLSTLVALKRKRSLPVRGAWVEIFPCYNGSGLTAVAPRAGSVG